MSRINNKNNNNNKVPPPKKDFSSRRWHVEQEPKLKPYYTVRSTHHLWNGAGWTMLSLSYGNIATQKLSEDAIEITKTIENDKGRNKKTSNT